MIKKTLFITALLFITYTVFLAWYKPSWDTAQNQWQDNIIKADRYIYDYNDTKKGVIIGSSLSIRLDMKSLPDMYNLSMNGGSLFDGLYIILHKDKLPKYVFIEMNKVLRKENKDFISSFNSPVVIYARKVVPSLRVENQPMGIVGKVTYSLKVKLTTCIKSFIFSLRDKVKTVLRKGTIHTTNTELTSNSKPDVSVELFNTMLNFQIESYSQYPDKRLLSGCFATLRNHVDALEKKGVTVVFFEMPVNGKLCNLPAARAVRETFYKFFPPDRYHYINVPDCSEYRTMDGEHLSPEEVIKYTDYFRLKSAECLMIK